MNNTTSHLPSSLPQEIREILLRELEDPSPPGLDPLVIWHAWSTLACQLIAAGYTKTGLTRLSELPGTCGLGLCLSRFVLYPRTQDWPANRRGRHHNGTQIQPWRSPRAAGLLYRAIRTLSRLSVRHHYGIASRAQAALDEIHQKLQIEDGIDAAAI